jgi:hypothetical protein
MDPIDPHVHIVGVGQRALGECRGIILPLRGQPRDRGRRQARGRSQELLQCRTKVAAGQSMQVQQRQPLGHLRRLTSPRRQDRRGEPLPLTTVGVDTLVVNPRRPHRHRTRGGQHLACDVVAVADHQPIPVLVDLTGIGIDVSGDLGGQRRREHRPRTVTHDLVEQRPARRAVLVGRIRVVDYLEHGRTFPNQRTNAGS